MTSKPTQSKKVRFRVNGKFGEWQDWDKMKVPEEVRAMETSELMTVNEIEVLKSKGIL